MRVPRVVPSLAFVVVVAAGCSSSGEEGGGPGGDVVGRPAGESTSGGPTTENGAPASPAPVDVAVWPVRPLVPGTWTKIAGWEKGPGRLEAKETISWFNMTFDSKRQRFYAVSWEGGLFGFDGTSWQEVPDSRTQCNDMHNISVVYDPVRDRFWHTDYSTEGGIEYGFRYFDLTTKRWTVVCEHCGPTYNPGLFYDAPRDRLVAFGGWQMNDGDFWTLPLGSTPYTWVRGKTSGIAPPTQASDASRVTHHRSGFDATGGRAWYVHTDGELWLLDPATLTWTKKPTAGAKPPAHTNYALHEASNKLVGFAGVDGYGDATTDPVVRKTFVLDLAALVWSELAPQAQQPSAANLPGMGMTYDPVRKQVLAYTSGDYETWALTLQ